MGIVDFFLPKLLSKTNPSNAMNANWAKVTMFPHPGKSLRAQHTSIVLSLHTQAAHKPMQCAGTVVHFQVGCKSDANAYNVLHIKIFILCI